MMKTNLNGRRHHLPESDPCNTFEGRKKKKKKKKEKKDEPGRKKTKDKDIISVLLFTNKPAETQEPHEPRDKRRQRE